MKRCSVLFAGVLCLALSAGAMAGEEQPCTNGAPGCAAKGPQTPAGAREAHVVREGLLKLYKEARERSAAMGFHTVKGDLVWVYETRDGWTFIRYVGKPTAELAEETELRGGWVRKDLLDELIQVNP